MARLLRAAAELHRRKDAVYGRAWKKRGEVFSIIPNIARKVDRIENVVDGGTVMDGESLLDTAIDLLLYCLKYATFLADQDRALGEAMFAGPGPAPPYSDGPVGVGYLLSKLATRAVSDPLEVRVAAGAVVARFTALEGCFRDAQSRAQTGERLRAAEALVNATIALLGSLAEVDAGAVDRFVAAHEVGGASS